MKTIRHTWHIVGKDGTEYRVWSQGVALPVAGELLQAVGEGAVVPRWYGFAYYDLDRDAKIFAPLGLNWLIGAWKTVRILLKFRLSGWLTMRPLQTAYLLGWRDGIERSVKHRERYFEQ